MSHFTKINVEIRDVEALKSACRELGLTVEQNAQARGYYRNTIKGDHVIRLNGPYDVALQRRPEGGYEMQADLWQGHVERELGRDFGRLRQLYGTHKAMREARRKGMTVRRRNLPNGNIRLNIARA